MRKKILSLIGLFFAVIPACGYAQDSNDVFRSTPYPIPRFVSLASNEINVRTGPNNDFPIRWVFRHENLPVEIILEYDVWRKIKDYEGQTGWIHESLLSGERTALIRDNEGKPVPLHAAARSESAIMAYVEPYAIAEVEACKPDWCRLDVSGYEGWMHKEAMWGVYSDEVFD